MPPVMSDKSILERLQVKKGRTLAVIGATPALGRALGGILWLAYPKLTSGLAADLSRDIIHELAPEYGLDTVSQIAIDGDWSALRLKRVAASNR
jgi:hypothetical protein